MNTLPIPQWIMLEVPHQHIGRVIKLHESEPDLFGTSLQESEPILKKQREDNLHLKKGTIYRANYQGKTSLFKISDIEGNVYEMTQCTINGEEIKNGAVEFAEELRFFGHIEPTVSE